MFFGGARGGGKTDGVLGKWAIKDGYYGQHFNAVMFRRTTVSAEDAIERSREIYGPLGGKFNEAKLRWRMPNGGRVSFAYLESITDANEYQGRNVTDAWVEEAGQYDTPDPIDRLYGVLRSAHGVPIQLILTANPGGSGQHWLRERYGLHPFPRGPKIITRQLPNGNTHKIAVIPSRITDNRVLLNSDPGYVDRLYLVGSAQLVKAWLEGDWTAIEGAFFDCWSEKQHVIKPFTVPMGWLRFRSGDWGAASPFSFGWWAVVQDDYFTAFGDGRTLPRGAIVRYREWYGAGKDGKGLRLTAEAQGEGIVSREAGDPKLSYGVLDPRTFAVESGPSIAERINGRLLAKKMAPFREADNKRVALAGSQDGKGSLSGWNEMRQRLVGTAKQENGAVNWFTGVPMMYFFETCRDSIRTIPTLQHDEKKAEDLDTTQEDHAADEVRYACMSRPWLKSKQPPPEKIPGYSYERDRDEGRRDAWKVDYEDV